MKYILLIIIFLFELNAFAEYPYTTYDDSYTDNGSVYEVTPLTPIKSQDGIGLCYAFAATSLLENYRCRELNLNCNDPHELLSSLDVTSYNQLKNLKEAGSTNMILSNIQKSNKKVAREECIQFSTLVHQIKDEKNLIYSNEKQGWLFLARKWNEYKGIGKNGEIIKRNDCVGCLVDSIKTTLVNIKTPADQIKNAFLEAHSMEEFLYKALLPSECLKEDKMASIPDFIAKGYPDENEGKKISDDDLSKKIESLLISNIPLHMRICSDQIRPCRDGSGHAIVLVGIKEVCSEINGDCKTVVKVKNSWGISWQKQTNDGWVDLNILIEASRARDTSANITWIERPGFQLKEKRLQVTKRVVPQIEDRPYVATPGNSSKPEKYKDYHGLWKCPGAKFTDTYEAGCVPMKK